jgi:hypothetical protein
VSAAGPRDLLSGDAASVRKLALLSPSARDWWIDRGPAAAQPTAELHLLFDDDFRSPPLHPGLERLAMHVVPGLRGGVGPGFPTDRRRGPPLKWLDVVVQGRRRRRRSERGKTAPPAAWAAALRRAAEGGWIDASTRLEVWWECEPDETVRLLPAVFAEIGDSAVRHWMRLNVLWVVDNAAGGRLARYLANLVRGVRTADPPYQNGFPPPSAPPDTHPGSVRLMVLFAQSTFRVPMDTLRAMATAELPAAGAADASDLPEYLRRFPIAYRVAGLHGNWRNRAALDPRIAKKNNNLAARYSADRFSAERIRNGRTN